MKKYVLLLVAVCSLTVMSAQKKVGGVELPAKVEFKGETLNLNGAGVREKFWIDLYAGGLYLTDKNSDAEKITNADKPMAIKLHIVSKLITSDKMIDAVNEGFENATEGKTAPIEAEIKRFQGFFSDEIKKNDVFDLVYIPGEGVISYKNGKEKGTIKGIAFKKALFGIWLSKKPAEDDLKEAMLGQ
ncbi:chalcone isomerase family protein [Zunongwangia sp. HRR-M8]|uniref:chalcone isomerase family protein n=1 Tax=Zunongwangia sp. HRR-M8 TaxID=3015170 RepID=UPI0022DE0515|nr:chalcone isomerase family protein [Zunongwangia sp. HRR-M8]WBL20895.1 chalcone isomerase family protein [Zunongwangia sp. HRR-M8]